MPCNFGTFETLLFDSASLCSFGRNQPELCIIPWVLSTVKEQHRQQDLNDTTDSSSDPAELMQALDEAAKVDCVDPAEHRAKHGRGRGRGRERGRGNQRYRSKHAEVYRLA